MYIYDISRLIVKQPHHNVTVIRLLPVCFPFVLANSAFDPHYSSNFHN
jgi:hypothetical protein